MSSVETGLQQSEGYGLQRQWLAEISLGFDRSDDPKYSRTRLKHLKHLGPLRVQRPFYPEGDCCHVYLLHPPGGLVSGDKLNIAVDVAEDAHCLITTPSAGKIYRSDSCQLIQRQDVQIKLKGRACCEWLPQETIVFDGAHGRTHTRVDLDPESRFIGWELYCLGRPANQLGFNSGSFEQHMQIYRDGRPLLLERQKLHGGSAAAEASWGYQGHVVAGSFYAVGFSEKPTELMAQIRETLGCDDASKFAITWRLDVLVARYLGDNAEQARACFSQLWQLLRPHMLQLEATEPRIWAT